MHCFLVLDPYIEIMSCHCFNKNLLQIEPFELILCRRQERIETVMYEKEGEEVCSCEK